MNQEIIEQSQKIEIPLLKYNLLMGVYDQLKKQAFLLRILEAEENLKRDRVKKEKIDDFLKRIK